jgi:hypothetical protein
MKDSHLWRTAAAVAVAVVLVMQELPARANPPIQMFNVIEYGEGGAFSHTAHYLGATSETLLSVCEHLDTWFIAITSVTALYSANKAGKKAQKEGLPYGDGFVDGLIRKSIPGQLGLAPTYIETNKGVYTGMRKLGDDPSLEGSWLWQQNQKYRKERPQSAPPAPATSGAAR